MGFFNWMRKPSESDLVYSVMNDDHVELYRVVEDLQKAVTRRCNGDTERSLQKVEILAIIKTLIDKAAEHFQREDA